VSARTTATATAASVRALRRLTRRVCIDIPLVTDVTEQRLDRNASLVPIASGGSSRGCGRNSQKGRGEAVARADCRRPRRVRCGEGSSAGGCGRSARVPDSQPRAHWSRPEPAERRSPRCRSPGAPSTRGAHLPSRESRGPESRPGKTGRAQRGWRCLYRRDGSHVPRPRGGHTTPCRRARRWAQSQTSTRRRER
jgi:hypothetical protein